ncbi:MAG: hypothetical protein Kow00121_29500 [Elainellaceae cyanobacterium]
MVLRSIVYMLMGVGLVAGVACVSLQSNRSSNQPESSPTNQPEVEATDTESPDSDQTQADTKVMTLNLGGTPTEVELRRFNQDPFPFQTYYPVKDFAPEISSSGEGNSVRFYYSPAGAKNEQAYLHIFMPKQPANVEAMQDLLLGEQGLFIRNAWQLVDRTDIVSYFWAEEKLIYQEQAEAMAIGVIYIGQNAGQAFYTITHYPPEVRDAFEPRVNLVLESLQFEDEEQPE